MSRDVVRDTVNACVSRTRALPALCRRFGLAGSALAAMLLLNGSPAHAQATFLPSSSTTDGRMLVLGGAPLRTLAGETMRIRLQVPATATSVEVGIFDGDTSTNWDFAPQPSGLEFILYADPDGDGTGTFVINRWLGNTMPDNAWWSTSIVPTGEARAADGSFVYNMVVRLLDPQNNVFSGFKLRSTGALAIRPESIGFMPVVVTDRDIATVYPGWTGPDRSTYPWQTAPTTFDGTFTFFMDVFEPETELVFWDGDVDLSVDTDDPDTPNTIPDWASRFAAQPEGAWPGLPLDDSANPIVRRSPNVYYVVTAPSVNGAPGAVYTNMDPSGNQEWEQFRIAAPAGQTVPVGRWTVQVFGLDINNVFFLRFPGFILGVDEGGVPPAEVDGKCGKVTGGGWIPLSGGSPSKGKKGDNNKATFAVHAMCQKGGGHKGGLNYQDHVRGLHIKSKTITDFVIDGTEARITGIAEINGGGSYEFVVVVNDRGEPGSDDDFFIRLSNGYTAGATRLGGGNIQLHPEK